ncbi:MAG: radical SAM protein, partial [Deltaproteobacteria bacterium]|nr:radical SAM protein [Deltaproteobacteria bacterium]
MTEPGFQKKSPQGRGAAENPRNRFEKLAWVDDAESYDPEAPGPATQFYRDSSKSLIVTNDSPDIP